MDSVLPIGRSPVAHLSLPLSKHTATVTGIANIICRLLFEAENVTYFLRRLSATTVHSRAVETAVERSFSRGTHALQFAGQVTSESELLEKRRERQERRPALPPARNYHLTQKRIFSQASSRRPSARETKENSLGY